LKPLPLIPDWLSGVFQPSICKTKHSNDGQSVELRERGQPDTVVQVTTNIPSHFGIVGVILDARDICRNSCVDVWEMPEIWHESIFLATF
jgi:hypothetical protein